MNRRLLEVDRDDVVVCQRESVHRLSRMSSLHFPLHTEHATEMRGRDSLEERHAGGGMWRGHGCAKEACYGT